MKIFKEYRTGLSSFFKAIPFIFKNKLGWFFLFPVIFQIAFFISGAMAVGELVDYTMAQLQEWWGIDSWEFPLAEYLGDTIYVIVWLMIKLTFVILFSYFSGYVVLIFLSPVLAYLSEKTEKILTGQEYPFDIMQLMRDIARGVLVALRNLFFELILTLGIFLIGFIPVIGWIVSPVLMFLVTAYYYGFSFIDYNNERRKYSFTKSARLMRANKAYLIGVATPFAGVLLIPFIGQMLAGFIAIISTVAGVMTYKKIEKKMDAKKEVTQHRSTQSTL